MKNHICPICKEKCNNHKKNNNLFYWFLILILISILILIVGILGYYNFHKDDWIDAIYNATAIMSGVGAAEQPINKSAQIFASFYTMFIGLFYLIIITVYVAIALEEINFFNK